MTSPSVPAPGERFNFAQHLIARNTRHPDKIAYIDDAGLLRYGELAQRVRGLAAALLGAGVRREERVLLLMHDCNDWPVSFLGALYAGIVPVAVNTLLTVDDYVYMLAHSRAQAVLVSAALLPTLQAALAQGPHEVKTIVVSRPTQGLPPDEIDFEDFVSAQPPLALPADTGPDDPGFWLYSSGSTGRPKGAMLSHFGVVHSCMHFQVGMGLGPQDCSIAAVPLSHVTGLVALVTTMLHAAGKLVILPAFKAPLFLDLAVRERMTHSLMVPAMYNLCMLCPEFDDIDLSTWRVGAYGGAPMPVASIEKLAQKMPRLMLMNCYGSTETTSPATLMPQGDTAAHNDTVGKPLACADMRVMDAHGRELPAGEMGEIWIKGPMVVKGYWDNPQATADNFTAGFWHSGDLGSIDAQGYVRVHDRIKDMINRGGYKIYTIEVENALYEHPDVVESAVVAKPCPVLGERVHAFVTLRQVGTSEAVLRDHCAQRLSDYKVPESITLSTTPLPRNANGKVLKRALRDQLTPNPPA